jgi:BirA family transcriptional regulator, biotin operon repressor / biotin---[acetyl-CoA-carboxylase] ligase
VTREPGFDEWAPFLEAAIRAEQISCVCRVVTLKETTSTQDAARELARGRPGLLVLADTQTAGRGRLGRSWAQGGDLGLAATFVLSTASIAAERLSLAIGLAAALAVEASLRDVGVNEPVGLRWPNDVVDRGAGGPGDRGPKIAGVLIEAAQGLALVGIGINVNHLPGGFPDHLRGRATSIRAIGADRGNWRRERPIDRLGAAAHLVRFVDRALAPGFDAMTEWARRDVLAGTRQSFRHDGRTVTGRVLAVDPLHLITVKTDDGDRVQLPALSTSLVHD